MRGLVVLSIMAFAAIMMILYSSDLLYIVHNQIISFQNPSNIKINKNYGTDISVELFAKGLTRPTSMSFINDNTILILEKDSGKVRVISHGVLLEKPAYTIENLSTQQEQGLLGIAFKNKSFTNLSLASGKTQSIQENLLGKHNDLLFSQKGTENYLKDKVYLYFTQKVSENKGLNYIDSNEDSDSSNNLRNRVYEFNFNNTDNSLVPNRLLLDLPANPRPYHNGGKIDIDKLGNLYVTIGDLTAINSSMQNYPGKKLDLFFPPNNTSGILRINPSVSMLIPASNPFYNQSLENKTLGSLSLYYAYGIRNSFGLDIDPVTGRVWDTENSESTYDELNLVEPGFNSGWYKIMGPLNRNNDSNVLDLVMLNGSHYSDPEFSWRNPIGVTDVEFYESSKLGKEFENNLFVGDINNGNLYFFKLNPDRNKIVHLKSIYDSKLASNESIEDFVADNKSELEPYIFAQGFDGRITDIQTGPDGNLYILSYFDGKIFRLVNS
ncbi:PQQ-dependent sugar dehydrogenase [Candidatus Nitrosocosmicus sp. SS]|nr:PQQ-dependent sugar dehydrogenase [Candidatus Nitrosocosmicus sp. SS]KAF0867764.1 PQQ-dependent sugar dehydrogenase [Candidatus Nitrosocosmicus sp. SS]